MKKTKKRNICIKSKTMIKNDSFSLLGNFNKVNKYFELIKIQIKEKEDLIHVLGKEILKREKYLNELNEKK